MPVGDAFNVSVAQNRTRVDVLVEIVHTSGLRATLYTFIQREKRERERERERETERDESRQPIPKVREQE